MYAVILSGGKQYKVAEGDTIRVEKLAVDEGAAVELDKVLLVADGDDVKIGAPYIDGGKVSATVKAQGRGKKVKIIKFRRRKHHMKRQGHRQAYTELEITGITSLSASVATSFIPAPTSAAAVITPCSPPPPGRCGSRSRVSRSAGS